MLPKFLIEKTSHYILHLNSHSFYWDILLFIRRHQTDISTSNNKNRCHNCCKLKNTSSREETKLTPAFENAIEIIKNSCRNGARQRMQCVYPSVVINIMPTPYNAVCLCFVAFNLHLLRESW